jgi:hypothetical protein
VDGAVDTKCEILILKEPHLALTCNRSTLPEILNDQKIFVVLFAEEHQHFLKNVGIYMVQFCIM